MPDSNSNKIMISFLLRRHNGGARGFNIREIVCMLLLLEGGGRSLDATGRVGCIRTAEATIQVPFVEKTEPQPLSALGRAMSSEIGRKV